MLTKLRTFSDEKLLIGSIFLSIIIGYAIRLAAPLQANFPLNDGGLFYAMIIDLQAAHYALPVFVKYNVTDIPFAYPPLAFYVTGLLSDLTHVSVLDLTRVLSAIISGLTIPVFYLLAKEITYSKNQIALAVFAFAFLPRDFAWLIMGGGITRSFGLLFALLTMTFAYRFYNGHNTRHLLTCILFGALTVLTHPEATVHTVITALVFYLWKDRSLKGLFLSLGIATAILALTLPWWGFVISRHGLDPFVAAMTASRQDSFNPLIGLVIFFRFMFTSEPFLPILSVLGLIGLFAGLAHRQTMLPAWIFILHLVEPRGGPLYMMIPLALLVGYALEKVILPAMRPIADNLSPITEMQALAGLWQGKVARYFLLFLFAYSALSAYHTSLKIKQELSLKSADIDAFAWVKENTPQDSQFILVTGQMPLRDAWSEWFPVLTERHSQATLFGYEWVNDGNFGNRVDSYNDLQACRAQDTLCLDEWTTQIGVLINYVYLRHQTGSGPFILDIYLEQDMRYEMVFHNDQTTIYHRTQEK